MARRFLISIALGFAFAVGALAPVAALAAPVLHPQVTVDNAVVRLGDIFDGVGDKANTVVATAPAFGHQAIYDASWLANVARANGISWFPATQTDHVTIERDGNTVTVTQIEAALRTAVTKALADRGQKTRAQVSVDNRDVALYTDPNADMAVQVRNLRLDVDNGRFTATIAANAEAGAEYVKVSGRMYEIADVPVLTRRVAPSDVIGPDDVRFIQVRSDQLNTDTITDPDALIGMSPRRQVADNVPLHNGDVRTPVVVTKGTLVTMVVQTPYMLLTAQGRAIEDGGRGQVIKVMNTQSKMTVDAVVESPSRVLVNTPMAAQPVADAGPRAR